MRVGIRNNKGEGLASQAVSIIIAIILIGAVSTAAVTQVSKANKSKVVSEFRVLSGDIETAVTEMGIFNTRQSTDTVDSLKETYLKYMKNLEKEYLHANLGLKGCILESDLAGKTEAEIAQEQKDNCVITNEGFYVMTDKVDPWGSLTKLSYSENATIGRAFSLFSGGPNGRFDTQQLSSLMTSETKYDDVCCIIMLKPQSDERSMTFDKFL